MPCDAVILVRPSSPGNLGSVLRVAANFGVPRVELVEPGPDPGDPEVGRWACGAERHLEIRVHPDLEAAAAPYHTLVGTASGRGRDNLPVVPPRDAVAWLSRRDPRGLALVFGNETRGLSREDLDRCDLVVRVPTNPEFPVLNLTQSVAILLAYLSMELAPPPPGLPEPAPEASVAALMDHLQEALLEIGFLDPANPQRILRKIRRLLGRAGATPNEVAILHGMCRQMIWAARHRPGGEAPQRDEV